LGLKLRVVVEEEASKSWRFILVVQPLRSNRKINTPPHSSLQCPLSLHPRPTHPPKNMRNKLTAVLPPCPKQIQVSTPQKDGLPRGPWGPFLCLFPSLASGIEHATCFGAPRHTKGTLHFSHLTLHVTCATTCLQLSVIFSVQNCGDPNLPTTPWVLLVDSIGWQLWL